MIMGDNVAKNRYINTHFWDDTYIIELDPTEKLLFIYLLSNPLTNICGIYEIPVKRIAFDTGIDKEMVIKILVRFEKDNKVRYEAGWLAIKNFLKHQAINTNIQKGIGESLKSVPKALKKWVFDKTSKAFQSLSKPSNYLNLNSNMNLNSNLNTNSKVKSKEPKKSFMGFDIILLTDTEYKKLINDIYKTESSLKEALEILDNYKHTSGNKYKSDYHTLLERGWVFREWSKRKGGGKPKRVEDLTAADYEKDLEMMEKGK